MNRNHPRCTGSGANSGPHWQKWRTCPDCERIIACLYGRFVEHWWPSPKGNRTETPQRSR